MLPQHIGTVIRQTRERLRVTQADLAKRSSVSAELLAAQEAGTRLLSTAKLDRIASALGLDPAALSEGREQVRGLVAHPKHAGRTDFRQEDLRALERALGRAESLRELNALLGRSTLLDQVAPAAPGAKAAADGYARATRVRALIGLPVEPLPELGTLLVTRFGIPVFREPLVTTALQAATVRASSSRAAAIVLNTHASGRPKSARQAALLERVDICHELCHALFDQPVDQLIDLTVDHVGQGIDGSRLEQRARAFAAELLLPREGLERLLGRPERTTLPKKAHRLVDEARAHYLTPLEIAVNHLCNRGFVALELRDSLLKAQSSVVSAPLTAAEAWRRALEALAQRAHDAGLITGGAVGVMLGIALGEPLPWENDPR